MRFSKHFTYSVQKNSFSKSNSKVDWEFSLVHFELFVVNQTNKAIKKSSENLHFRLCFLF